MAFAVTVFRAIRTVEPAPARTPTGLLLTTLSSSVTAALPPGRRASSPAVQLSERCALRVITVVPSAAGTTAIPAPGKPRTVT